MKTCVLEQRVVRFFRPRQNIVIPNVSWGFLSHEADMLVVTAAGCLYEVELKVSRADLLRDLLKRKWKSKFDSKSFIKYMYFAVPKNLVYLAFKVVPEYCGIIDGGDESNSCAWEVRSPKQLSSYKVGDAERLQLYRLGALRVWGLKAKIAKLMEPGSR